ncbi:MAG TPA: GNAT family N-acetyltransferase [Rhizomicrobium sp.]|jgi:GNAT superfamily N-acetyltransferase
MLVTLAAFDKQQEAHLFAGRLRAEGIFAVTLHGQHVGNNWLQSIALGGAKVAVSSTEYEAAKAVERLCRDCEFKRQLAAEFGNLDDLCCPYCGSSDYWKRRPIAQLLLSGLSLAFGGILPPWRWIFTCNVCGREFKSRYGLIGKVSGFQFPMDFAEAALPDVPDMQRLRERREKAAVDSGEERILDPELVPSDDRRGWVCRIEGALRGFSLADRRTRRLAALLVDPDFERCGIGRQLHNSAVDWLFANGPQPIWTTVAPYTKSYKFLRAARWKLSDQEPNGDYRMELEADIWRVRRKKF